MRKAIIKSIDALLITAGAIATILLILLVAVVSYNVIGRYLFSASSIGLEELSWHFYATTFLLAIPYAVHTDSHVRIDLVYASRSEAYKRNINIIGTFIFLFPFALVTLWYGAIFTLQAIAYGDIPNTPLTFLQQMLTSGIGEKSQDPGGLSNRFIIKGVIPLSAFLLFLSGVSKILKEGQSETDHQNNTPPAI